MAVVLLYSDQYQLLNRRNRRKFSNLVSSQLQNAIQKACTGGAIKICSHIVLTLVAPGSCRIWQVHATVILRLGASACRLLKVPRFSFPSSTSTTSCFHSTSHLLLPSLSYETRSPQYQDQAQWPFSQLSRSQQQTQTLPLDTHRHSRATGGDEQLCLTA
jgi:hypothetical protein